MTNNYLSEAQEEILEILREGDASADEIAENINRKGISQRISELRKMGYSIDVISDMGKLVYTLNEDTDEDISEEEIDVSKYYKSSKRRRINDSVRAEMRNIIEAVAEKRAEVPEIDFSGIDYTEDGETLVILNSDWHIGKKVENESGVETFNPKIAKRRLNNFSENIYKLANIVKRGTDIDEVVILDVGDMIEGEMIYDTQYAHLSEFLPHQVDIALKQRWKQIETLRDCFDCPIRSFSVYGNHGRMKNSYSEISNFDTVVQMTLSTIKDIVGYEDVLIDNSHSDIATRQVRDKTIFMKHKGPKQTETAAAKAKWGGWLANFDFDIAVTGHWHHAKICSFQDSMIFYNGSIVGPDDLSKRMGVSSEPRQIMFGVSRSHVPSFIYPVDVTCD